MHCSFKNDYTYGCHPDILKKLVKLNLESQAGYGEDHYSLQAKKLMKKRFACSEASVHFISGGTQTNLLFISSVLKSFQSVIAAHTGHIFTNEAGAIENCGHKVHAASSTDGKLTPKACEAILETVTNVPHVVQPKLIYISNSTELGTHYSLRELQDLSEFCRQNDLYLFMDGARLAQALTVENGTLKPNHIAGLVDAFYLGGTKNGALFGEALVITNPDLKTNFPFYIKQKGAMLAKGRSLGIQFSVLLEDDLFLTLGKMANSKAKQLKTAFEEIGCQFLTDSSTNQLFPILSNTRIKALKETADFYVWKKINKDFSAIRLITSWATPDNQIDFFIRAVKNLN